MPGEEKPHEEKFKKTRTILYGKANRRKKYDSVTCFIGGYNDSQARDIFLNKALDLRTWGHLAAYKGNIFPTNQLNLIVSCICVVHADTRKPRSINEYKWSARPCVQNVRFTYLALALHILTDGSVLSTCAALGCSLLPFPAVSWLCLAQEMMEQERDSAIQWMEMHHLKISCHSPACACISSPVLQHPPLDAGAVRIEGLEYTICLLEKKRQQSSLLVPYSIVHVCIYVYYVHIWVFLL